MGPKKNLGGATEQSTLMSALLWLLFLTGWALALVLSVLYVLERHARARDRRTCATDQQAQAAAHERAALLCQQQLAERSTPTAPPVVPAAPAPTVEDVLGQKFTARRRRRPVHLFINFFESPDPLRQAENLLSLERNIALSTLDAVHCVVDDVEHFSYLTKQLGDKCLLHGSDRRPTFRDFFGLFDEGHLNIVANADIEFTPSLHLIHSYRWTDRDVFALSRCERNAEGELETDPKVGQDAWVFWGRPQHLRATDGAFYLGKAYCDNAIAHQLVEAGYRVYNPSYSIELVHHHASNVRTWTLSPDDIVPGPYRHVLPLALECVPLQH